MSSALVEPLDHYDEVNVKLYSVISAVLMWSQYVEEMLAMHVFLSNVVKGKTPRTELRVSFESLNRSTLGHLHDLWRKSNQLPDKLDGLIMRSKTGRNFVCHRIFVEDKERILHPVGKVELITKCIEIAKDMKQLYFILNWMYKYLAEHLGIDISRAYVTQDVLKARAAKRFDHK